MPHGYPRHLPTLPPRPSFYPLNYSIILAPCHKCGGTGLFTMLTRFGTLDRYIDDWCSRCGGSKWVICPVEIEGGVVAKYFYDDALPFERWGRIVYKGSKLKN